MTWTCSEIRLLRQRLGWSVAEMARRMGCGCVLVEEWEAGIRQPESVDLNQLNYLYAYVEANAEATLMGPMADNKMHQDQLAQIDYEIIRQFTQSDS